MNHEPRSARRKATGERGAGTPHELQRRTTLQNPALPLRTAADYNAEQAKKVPRG